MALPELSRQGEQISLGEEVSWFGSSSPHASLCVAHLRKLKNKRTIKKKTKKKTAK